MGADSACYDLQQHSDKFGVSLQASIRLKESAVVEQTVVEVKCKVIWLHFKAQQKRATVAIEGLIVTKFWRCRPPKVGCGH